jgi:hypothetical protein
MSNDEKVTVSAVTVARKEHPMPKASSSCFTLTLIITALFGLSVGAHASSIEYITPPGTTTPGGPVDASAKFTTGTGMITVTLTNLQGNTHDAGQNLSDLFFTVSNGSVIGATETGGSATAITIGAGGVITMTTPLSTPSAIAWVLSAPTSTELKLDVLLGPGHGGPAKTIIGPPNPTGNPYSNANGSIAGSSSHNPFLEDVATWVIAAPVTSDTTITSTTFSFGTTAGVDRAGTVIPEPSSMLLLSSGVLILVQGFRRKLM